MGRNKLKLGLGVLTVLTKVETPGVFIIKMEHWREILGQVIIG